VLGVPPRRLRADAARNRQTLIEAAERLFAARGLSVTLDDIALEAGVNVATAYRHFANKHELIAASLERKINQAVEMATEAAAADDPWAGLCQFLRRTLEFMTANRALHDVFLPGQGAEWLGRLDEEMQPVLGGLIERGQKAGVVRAGLEPRDLGVILQMLATVSDIGSPDPGQLVARYLEIVLAGLRPAPGTLPGSPPSAAEVFAAGPGKRRRSH
jgi:AcrR family transcriptional regulator